MPLAGFEPVNSASKRPKNHALDGAAIGTADHGDDNAIVQ